MSKERYNQIIDAAYGNYIYNQIIDAAYGNYIYNPDYKAETVADLMGSQAGQLFKCPTQEDFINQCKTDTTFSNKWGLKIEERELSLEERSIIAKSNHYEVSQNIKMFVRVDEDHSLHKNLDDGNIPTKLITLTYNGETIESYE